MFVAPVKASDIVYGDLTGEGTVTVNDAIIVLRSVVGLVVLDGNQEIVADVNQDGTVNVTDAIIILRYIVGLTDSLPVDEDYEIPVEEGIIHGVYYGDLQSTVIGTLGKPGRIDLSKYRFEWFTYNQDYSNYIQVGIEDGKVVALYTNTGSWKLSGGIGIGSSYKEVEEEFGEWHSDYKESWTYLQGDHTTIPDGVGEQYYITFFFDLLNERRVTSVKLVDRVIRDGFMFYPQPSAEWRDSFEKQVFDLANAVRVRQGAPPFEWCGDTALVARAHSEDMAERDYFAHENPDGEGPSDRMQNAGISFRGLGENIAAGHSSAIRAHEKWMNSGWHRYNILGGYARLGVGVSMDKVSSYRIYYTQKFYSP